MRKLIKLALLALGIRALLRWRKSRQEAQATSPTPAPPSAEPADELRRKLADSRADDADVEVEEPPAASVADRRAEVHEQGRGTLDEMKPSDES